MTVWQFLSPIFGSPLPWVLLGGVFVGAALARVTRRARTARDPDRARSRKWVLTCVYLSLAVIFGLCAVFLPGPSRIMDARLAWAAGGGAALTFLAMRFRKALGIPVLLLLLAAGILLGLFLQSIRAYTGETEIAAVRVIKVDGPEMRLELVPRGSEPVLLTMKGEYFAPLVKVVIFDDLLVFLGARTWYRFEGLTSFDGSMRQQDTDYRLPHPQGISEALWTFFENNETRVPGVKTAQIEMVLKKAKELSSFGIRVQNDGGVEVVPKSG